jgi:glycyl-tRNA synthetase beta chain
VAADDYAAGLRAVARLAPSLEAFFNEVLVLDPDEAKRASRVALLRAIGASIDRLADLSQLVVDKAEYR